MWNKKYQFDVFMLLKLKSCSTMLSMGSFHELQAERKIFRNEILFMTEIKLNILKVCVFLASMNDVE